MLLLLFAGAGIATPSVDGVRAYGRTTYATVFPSATTFRTAHAAWGALRGVTDADGGQTVVTQAGGATTPRTNADTTEE